MSNVIRNPDGMRYVDQLEARIAALERAANVGRKIITVSTATEIELGDFDGESIQGIRITIVGTTQGHVTNSFMRLRMNSSSAGMSMSRTLHTVYWDGASALSQLAGSNAATVAGFAIVDTNWTVDSNHVWSDGIMYTRTGVRRQYMGRFMNMDNVTNVNRRLDGLVSGVWFDGTTPLTSLSLAMDAGNFTGNITTEIVP